jgi:hypothetical protein
MSLRLACFDIWFLEGRQARAHGSNLHQGLLRIELTAFSRSCILTPFRSVAGVTELRILPKGLSSSFLEQIIALVRPGELQSGL